MVHFTLALVAAAAALLPSALAAPVRGDLDLGVSGGIPTTRLTNAQRLGRGLGPLPPTRRSSALKSRQSSSSASNGGNTFGSTPFYIAHVHNPADGSDYGVVSAPSGDSPVVSYNDPNSSSPVRFSGPDNGDGSPFEMSPGGGDDGSVFGGPRKVLGAIPGKNQGRDMKSGHSDYANMGWGTRDPSSGLLDLQIPILLGAPSTSAGPLADLLNPVTSAVPSASNGGFLPGPAQSTIWTFDPASRRLIAHYVNSDGQAVPTSFVTGGAEGCQHTICLVADVGAFQNAYGSDAVEVQLLATVDL